MNRTCGLIFIGCFALSMAENQRLSEPDKWFSIPHVGITRIETLLNGVSAHYKGTIAYKNILCFERFEFDLSVSPSTTVGKTLLFQFNKQRRDASVDDHHLHGFQKSNISYGLLFYADGKAALVKTAGERDILVLLNFSDRFDYTLWQRIRIEQSLADDILTIRVSIGPKHYVLKDHLANGYAAQGYIGLTLFNGQDKATLSNISFEGKEIISQSGERPRPVYLADYFQEGPQRFIHWRYDEWTSDYQYVRIENEDGELLDITHYPHRIWPVPSGFQKEKILLRAVNVDGLSSEPVVVKLVDERLFFQANDCLPRIRIGEKNGISVFLQGDANKPFMIKGFNYVRLRYGDHATFEAQTPIGPAHYDPFDAESVLLRLRKYGYNTVRVFISGRHLQNPGISGYYENPSLYAPYMDNVIDFLRRAQRYSIYVLPTLCDGELPRTQRYWQMMEGAVQGLKLDDITSKTHNAIYFTAKGHAARARYAAEFLGYIKEKAPDVLTVLLGLQCQNEISIRGDQWPFTLQAGQFIGPDEKSYDMSDDAQRHRLFENAILTYHQAMANAIKAIVPDILISEGMFVPRIVGRDYEGASFGIRMQNSSENRFPPQAAVIAGGAIDFIDIHIYYVNKTATLAESYRLDMISTGFDDLRRKTIIAKKPFIMGEFGAFKFMSQTPAQAIRDILETRDLALKDDTQGYLMWTFDTSEQKSLWNGCELGEKFLSDLSVFLP